MIVILQVLLRLVVAAIVAVGAWAGVSFGEPAGEPQVAEVSEHTKDVAARIESTGFANFPEGNRLADAATDTAAPTTKPQRQPERRPEPAPAAPKPPTSTTSPRPAPTEPLPLPEPPRWKPEPAPVVEPQPEPEEPEESWIEQKLPESLYDPVDGAADEEPENDDALARSTTVNIACVEREGAAIRVSSGSGVVVSPDGLVLTNAHVAYHFLLDDDGVDCSVTHPSFPVFGYPARAVYVSPDWVRANGHVIAGGGGSATGEEDYAFVAFAAGSAPTTHGRLAHAPVSVSEPVASAGDEVTVAGYPGAAGTLEGYGSLSRLRVDRVYVEDTDSFARATADILQTSPTDVAAVGSSGGGAFRDGSLVGITATIYGLGRGNGINALSTAWINRDLRRDAGVSVADLVSEDHASAADSFWSSDGDDLADLVRAARR